MEARVFHNSGGACYIPIELHVGDKIMIVSHGKIVGVTDVKESGEDTVILTKTHYAVGEEIPKRIHTYGFITTKGVYDVFHYNPLTCEKLGFKFKEFAVN